MDGRINHNKTGVKNKLVVLYDKDRRRIIQYVENNWCILQRLDIFLSMHSGAIVVKTDNITNSTREKTSNN